MQSAIVIERYTRVAKGDYQAIAVLLPQLSAHAHLAASELERVVDDAHNHVFVARDDARIVGVGILIAFYTLTGQRGRIEDLVVDEHYRGRGVGMKIMEHLIVAARGRGLEAIELSSRFERAAANKLYQKLDFQKKETNVYRLKL